MDKLLTPDEAATKLKITPRTIRSWLKEGKIKGVKVGRLWRIEESELNALFKKKE